MLHQEERGILQMLTEILETLPGSEAHARGLAGYWRTPRVLRTKAGREAVGLLDGERFLGLIHLGPSRGVPPVPERAPLETYRFFLR